MPSANNTRRLWALLAGWSLIALIALATVSLLLLNLGLSPLTLAGVMIAGISGSWQKFHPVLAGLIPLLLCACGLLFTFRAGLWNIGVEGQMIVGAIGATFVLRQAGSGLAPTVLIALALWAAFAAGGLWGIVAGLLKNRGGVNEIFGGLGLNFVAQAAILWLILGPWQREGMASMSGTDLFKPELWLFMPQGWRVAPSALILAVGAFLLTALLLGASRFGLRLKAVGCNPLAARLFRLHPGRIGLAAMFLGGGLAGLAGGLQVAGVYHRLIPPISSGYGYLALLIVMLANYTIMPVPFIALFFAALVAGSIQLPIVLQLDSSLSGVIQGACVLSALLVHGLRQQGWKESK